VTLSVQEGLGRDPHAGDVFVFRGRQGGLIKCLWHDGLGMSPHVKRLERGRFIWTSPAEGRGLDFDGPTDPSPRRDRLEEPRADMASDGGGEDDLVAEQAAATTGRKPFPAHPPRERVVIPAPPGLWVYVRDDRPRGGPTPPAAIFRYFRARSHRLPSGAFTPEILRTGRTSRPPDPSAIGGWACRSCESGKTRGLRIGRRDASSRPIGGVGEMQTDDSRISGHREGAVWSGFDGHAIRGADWILGVAHRSSSQGLIL